MHIAISWATEGAGGSGRVTADLAKYLPAQGIDVLGAVSAPPNVAEVTGGKILNVAPGASSTWSRMLGARKTITQIINEKQPQIVASHFALYTFPALDRLKRSTHVVHFHGPWSDESREEGADKVTAAVKHWVEETVYSKAARVIVLSRAFADLATRSYGVPEAIVRIIPGAVDLERFAVSESRQQARETLDWPKDRRILVSVRRLANRMGLGTLVAAMQRVTKEYPDTILYIAGKGRLREALQAQIEESGLHQHVKLLGYVPDTTLPLLYRAADMNIVPTLALEGFGLVAAEALAAGTPSIVTPVGGLPEVVAPLSENLIFPSSKQEDLEQHLLTQLSHPELLPSEQACRSYAAEHFNASLMAMRTAAVYREVL
ncbi:glycosyltransferase family 4 protein [Alloacidobacterium dinghuense]|uniref:glycosyltransferase family 4 protein n=1 Tax=Alloacidobacterium dinghuense TaxID=2763107 RepID=UPI00203726C1|nr:glycosyltransferase family 4 protein [Alloacidobacterium dinghuense]